MSTQTTTTNQESFEKIAKKSGKTIAEIEEAFNKALTTIPASYSDAQKTKYALKLVNNEFSINAKSDAVTFEGIIVGPGGVRDLMKGLRAKALKDYQDDPQAALDAGLIKIADDGTTAIVLDNRAEKSPGVKNPKFGTPRPDHMYLREPIIVARKPGEANFTVGKISLWNEQARIHLPVGQFVGFKALGSIDPGTDELALRGSVQTQFEVKNPTMSEEDVLRIIDDSFEKHQKTLGQCFDYAVSIQGTPEQWNHFVVTEGTVQFPPSKSTDPSKGHRIVLTDDSLPENSPLITAWLPYPLGNLINFGKGSIVTLVTQCRIKKGWDNELKQKTDEDVLQLNAFSVFRRPGLYSQPNEEEELI